MSATDEQKAIVTVLGLLLQQGEEWIKYAESASRDAMILLRRRFTPLKRQELDNSIVHGRDRRGQFGENRAIFIKPPEKEKRAAAAIRCHWNLDGDRPRWGFYFGMWSEPPKRPENEEEQDRRQIVFVGFRYETPGEDNIHDYYHAQPCRSMGDMDSPIVQALPISERNPTFPLAAKSALELLLCLVVSLYGMNVLIEWEKRISGDPSLRGQRLLLTTMRKFRELGETDGE